MNNIIHPVTGESHSLYSEQGKKLLKNYVMYYQNGSSRESQNSVYESINSEDDSPLDEEERNSRRSSPKSVSRPIEDDMEDFPIEYSNELLKDKLKDINKYDEMMKNAKSREEKKDYREIRNNLIVQYIPNEQMPRSLSDKDIGTIVYLIGLKMMHNKATKELLSGRGDTESLKNKKDDAEKLIVKTVTKDHSILNKMYDF